MKDEVRIAFADALRVIWETMLGILGIGALASLLMRALPLQNVVDEKWAMNDPMKKESENKGDFGGQV